MTMGLLLGGRRQRDWASRVERDSLMPSVPCLSRHPHTQHAGAPEVKRSDSSREQQQQQQVEDANGRSSHAARQMTLLHTSSFIRMLTAVHHPPAMLGPRICGVAPSRRISRPVQLIVDEAGHPSLCDTGSIRTVSEKGR